MYIFKFPSYKDTTLQIVTIISGIELRFEVLQAKTEYRKFGELSLYTLVME